MSLRRLFASHKRPDIVGLSSHCRSRVNLSGCELQLTLPPHNSLYGFDEKVAPRDIANIYEASLYDEYEENPPFSQVQFIRRYWNYFGPIWDGPYMAVTDFMATVMRVNCLPEGMSCLNPYHLEQVVMRFLYRLGPEKSNFGEKVAPINWRIENKQGHPWIICEEHYKPHPQIPVDPKYSVFTSFAIAAIDDHHVVSLSFANFGSLPINDSIAACNTMRDKVLNSICWQLSPGLQARKEVVLQQFSNTSISQQAQSQQAKIKWLIHGEGCGSFVQALTFIKKNPKSSDLFVAQKAMDLQEVCFSNPRGAGTAKADLEKLCKDIGIKTVTININKHDVFFNPDARKSLRNKAMFTAGGVTLAGGASGFASGELGIDTIQKLIEFAQSNPSLTLSGGLFVAGGVAVIVQKAGNLNAFARNLKGVWDSSVGSGNQRWAG